MRNIAKYCEKIAKYWEILQKMAKNGKMLQKYCKKFKILQNINSLESKPEKHAKLKKLAGKHDNIDLRVPFLNLSIQFLINV